jgi:hypothetical protein
MQKPNPPRGRPARFLPHRRMVEGHARVIRGGRRTARRQDARAIALALPDLFPRAPPYRSAFPESLLTPPARKGLPRQPDIPRSRNPPPPSSGGIGGVRMVGHGSPPEIGAKAPTQARRGEPDHLSHVGGCRKAKRICCAFSRLFVCRPPQPPLSPSSACKRL